MTRLKDIPILITEGRLDPILEDVVSAAIDRQKVLRAKRGRENLRLKPGTKVRLINLRPQYLSGTEATIEYQPGTPKGRLVVYVDPGDMPSRSRFRFSSYIVVHPSCVEVLGE